MEVVAQSKYIRTSARKVRLVADAVRGLLVKAALVHLEQVDKRAARPVRKTVLSALSNAKNNFHLSENELKIKDIQINEGPTYKRIRPISRGQAHPIAKRTSHIKVILEMEKKQEGKKEK